MPFYQFVQENGSADRGATQQHEDDAGAGAVQRSKDMARGGHWGRRRRTVIRPETNPLHSLERN